MQVKEIKRFDIKGVMIPNSFVTKNLVIIFLFFCTIPIQAQNTLTIQGSIEDVFLHNGLFDCHVSLLTEDSVDTKAEIKVYEAGSDSLHFTTFYRISNIDRKPATYFVHVQKKGYEDGWAKVIIPDNFKEERLQVPMIDIRKSMKSVNLDEVVVKATRVKVMMRGDTLVYDATAFNLPKGSMLSHLIEQLPGARMNDAGEIFINGRKIDELTLNSKSFFKGSKEVLMENLPYYTVKELKVFERPRLEFAMSGLKDDKPQYVMDVNLKNEYAVGSMINADVAGGTHDRYTMRGFSMLLTKTAVYGLYGNLNNINDEGRVSSAGRGWYPGQGFIHGNENKPSIRKGGGFSMNYQSDQKDIYGYSETQYYADITVDHYDNTDESQTYREYFLPSGSTFSQSNHNLRDKNFIFQFDQQFFYTPLKLSLKLETGYKQDHENFFDSTQQWDSLNATASQLTNQRMKLKHYQIPYIYARLPIYGIKNLWLELEGGVYHDVREAFNRQTSISGNAQESLYRHEYENMKSTMYNVEPKLTYGNTFWGKIRTDIIERYKISGNNSNDPLYVLSNLDGWGIRDSVAIDLLPSNRDMLGKIYDTVNSTRSHLRQHENELALFVRHDKDKSFPLYTALRLSFYYQRERLAYRRGEIDTIAHHNLFTLNPTITFANESLWSLNFGMKKTTPGIMNLMPYHDARNPLSIIEGNPDLKDNRQVNASGWWQPFSGKGRKAGVMSGRLSSNFIYYIRSVAQGFTYDRMTSAYTYRPENVNGNWTWNTSYTTSVSLAKSQKWWIDSETGCNVWHSIDYASIDGFYDTQLNKVETVNLSEDIKMRYSGKNTKFSLLGNLLWRRTWGHRSSSPSISAYDYRYGMTLQQTIPSWDTSLNVDATMNSRRGYSTSTMNKDECVVNASVTKTLFNGHWKFTLEGHDIFHQISNKTYEVNAQGRTEKWYRVTPNYVMLHCAYNFYVSPKH